MNGLTHFDDAGASRMVDVSGKPITKRTARASGRIEMLPETLRAIVDREVSKGDVREVARLAGIMAAKKTSDWIPLCHPLPLSSVRVDIEPDGDRALVVQAECQVESKTGVEMEALTAVSATCLTIYDMCKAIDRQMRITAIQLDEKSGGRSGHFLRSDASRTEKSATDSGEE